MIFAAPPHPERRVGAEEGTSDAGVVHSSRDLLLTTLDAHGEATLDELAGALGWNRPRTGMSLLRAKQAGLVCRSRHVYRVSERGRSRLAWWRERSGQ